MTVSLKLFGKLSFVLAVSLGLGACASSNNVVTSEIYDPYEARNREVHEFNRSLDRAIVRPASNGYGSIVPEEGREVVSNFSEHLGLPADVINNVLQGNLRGAGNNSLRFVVNSVFGIFGLADAAEEFGIPHDDTDFGETLYVWGMKEGSYVELPALGPSTSRDTLGTLLDFTLDPASALLPRSQRYLSPTTTVLDQMGNRYEFRDSVDGLLYESADSYAQARSLYLQNRRYELGVTVEAEDGDPFSDPFADPFSDPFAQ